jgi:hypothetical protein
METSQNLVKKTEISTSERENPALEAFLDYLAVRLATEYVSIIKQLEKGKKE